MILKVSDICEVIEGFAPLSLQEGWDNSGLLVGLPDQPVERALLTIDITEEVVAEAAVKGAQMVISHHPVMLSGIKRLTGYTDTERAVMLAIRHNIAIYAAHTNMDVTRDGVSYRMAYKLGLCDVHPLQTEGYRRQSETYDEANGIGHGVRGALPAPTSEKAFLQSLKEVFHLKTLRHTAFCERAIQKVALCGGSGIELLETAISSGADAFVTADVKYHRFAEVEKRLLLADIGHFESEQFTKEIFYELLSKKYPTFAVSFSEVNTNPINYL